MKELINETLLAVITVCVPILAGYGVKLIKSWTQTAIKDTQGAESDLVQSYLEEISRAVTTAVSYTSQTYVDSLKASGSFTVEAQKKALEKSIAAALSILTPAAADFIEQAYGDAKEYIIPLIEAEVRKQKITMPETAVLSGIEVTSGPDAATVAASTAAATAASLIQSAINQIDTTAQEATPGA